MVALEVQVKDLFVHKKENLFVCIEEGPFFSKHFFLKPYLKFVLKNLQERVRKLILRV